MKKVILSFAVAAIALGASAQKSEKSFNIAAGIRAAVPTGNALKEAYSFGIGAFVGGEYMFSDNAAATVDAGYTNFLIKSKYKEFGKSVGQIPVLVGARFYPAQQFFVGAKVGVSFLSSDGESTTAFSYAPQVGYNAEKFQIGLEYMGASKSEEGFTFNYSSIGLTAAFKF